MVDNNIQNNTGRKKNTTGSVSSRAAAVRSEANRSHLPCVDLSQGGIRLFAAPRGLPAFPAIFSCSSCKQRYIKIVYPIPWKRDLCSFTITVMVYRRSLLPLPLCFIPVLAPQHTPTHCLDMSAHNRKPKAFESLTVFKSVYVFHIYMACSTCRDEDRFVLGISE